MLRLILIEAVLFALPFALWFGWRAIMMRKRGSAPRTPRAALVAAGGVLMVAGLLVFAQGGGGGRGETVYIPAHVVDGRVVPGRFVPIDEAGDLAGLDPKERAEREQRRAAEGDSAP